LIELKKIVKFDFLLLPTDISKILKYIFKFSFYNLKFPEPNYPPWFSGISATITTTTITTTTTTTMRRQTVSRIVGK